VSEEQVERTDAGLPHAVPAGLGHDMGQIAFQQRPVDVGEGVDAGLGEERAEADDRVHSAARRGDAQPAGQPHSGPPFRQLA
jgi:hypothetical protein